MSKMYGAQDQQNTNLVLCSGKLVFGKMLRYNGFDMPFCSVFGYGHLLKIFIK